MSTEPSGDYQTLGTRTGGIVLGADSDDCPGCGESLADHGFANSGPGGAALLAPCGLDVTGISITRLVEALGSATTKTDD